jgi:trehalose/maltose hydrolase-like predicted phosphorylase
MRPRPADLAALAANATAALADLPPADLLFAEHAAVVLAWRAARVEVAGAPGLARAINSTLYAMAVALAPGVEFSTAPGGLSTGGRWTADGVDTHENGGFREAGSSYYGHVFWDADVWVLPGVLPLFPAVARSMVAYRARTVGQALANAAAEGHRGTKWAWESAFSGESATGTDTEEIHLQVHRAPRLGCMQLSLQTTSDGHLLENVI